jgi:hypothetical protein
MSCAMQWIYMRNPWSATQEGSESFWTSILVAVSTINVLVRVRQVLLLRGIITNKHVSAVLHA